MVEKDSMSEELDVRARMIDNDLYMLRKEMMEHQIVLVNIVQKIEQLDNSIKDIEKKIEKIESASEAQNSYQGGRV